MFYRARWRSVAHTHLCIPKRCEALGSEKGQTEVHLPWQYQELKREQGLEETQPSSIYTLRDGLGDS